MALVEEQPELEEQAEAVPEPQPAPRPLVASAQPPLLSLILALALLRGLIALLIIPPWQHFEEPTHLEFSVLVRDLGQLPELEYVDSELRRQIGESMLRWNFFGPVDQDAMLTRLVAEGVGINVRVHQPLYYLLTARVLQPFREAQIETQLYLARGLSLLFFVGLIGVAALLLQRLFPDDPATRYGTLLGLIALTPLSDINTAVNNDALANLAGALLLLACVTLLRHGITLRTLLLCGAALTLAFFSKRTLFFFMLLVPVALIMVTRIRLRWLGLAGIGAGVVGLLVLAFLPSTPAYWFYPPELRPQRVSLAEAPHGSAALYADGGTPLSQRLTNRAVQSLRGNEISLGGWVRADTERETSGLYLQIDQQLLELAGPVGPEWRFVSQSVRVPEDATLIQVLVQPAIGAAASYDGLLLVRGARATSSLPQFDAPDAQRGSWDGRRFYNILNNGSMELGIPSLASLNLLNRILPENNAQRTLSWLFDLSYSVPTLGYDLGVLSQSFWGAVGWGNVQSNLPMRLLTGSISALAVLGCFILTWRLLSRREQLEEWRRRSLLLLGLALLLAWGTANLRTLSQPFPYDMMFWPTARYTFVAAVPAMLAVVLGVQQLFPAHWRRSVVSSLVLLIWLHDLLMIGTVILPYYYR